MIIIFEVLQGFAPLIVFEDGCVVWGGRHALCVSKLNKHLHKLTVDIQALVIA